MDATLFVVATPIGNLEDMTARARRVLGEVDVVACEDTRRTGRLLQHLGVKAQLLSYHAHNEAHRTAQLIDRMTSGESVAVVSDAGTPCISDPGQRLVSAARDAGIRVVPVPGASAVMAALMGAGLPTASFKFVGFLERAAKARRASLERIAQDDATSILYESPKRLVALLGEAISVMGPGRLACVARELTKLHEELVRGDLQTLLAAFSSRDTIRGEVTVVIAGAEPVVKEATLGPGAERLIEMLLDRGLAPREVRDIVAATWEISRKAVYTRVLQLGTDRSS